MALMRSGAVVGDLGEGWWAPVQRGVLRCETLGAGQDLVRVDRQSDQTRVAVEGTGDGLTHPPIGISTHRVAARRVEQLEPADQAEVTFLNQVEKVHAAVLIALCDGDHQPGVGRDHHVHRSATGALHT
jgi:hypothetical protein